MFIGCLHEIHTRPCKVNKRKTKSVRIEEFFFFKTLYYECWQCFIISVPLLLKSALWLKAWYCWYCWVLGDGLGVYNSHITLNAPRTNNILFFVEKISFVQCNLIQLLMQYIILCVSLSTPGSCIRVNGLSEGECCNVEKYHFQNHQKRNPETLS